MTSNEIFSHLLAGRMTGYDIDPYSELSEEEATAKAIADLKAKLS